MLELVCRWQQFGRNEAYLELLLEQPAGIIWVISSTAASHLCLRWGKSNKKFGEKNSRCLQPLASCLWWRGPIWSLVPLHTQCSVTTVGLNCCNMNNATQGNWHNALLKFQDNMMNMYIFYNKHYNIFSSILSRSLSIPNVDAWWFLGSIRLGTKNILFNLI